MDRVEVWEHTVTALEQYFTSGQFEPGEFTVLHNTAGGTITVVESKGRTGSLAGCDAMTLADTTGSYNTGGSHEDDPVHIVLPTGSLAERLRRTLLT